MKNNNIFALIGRYRTELMGIAIIGVLLGHSAAWMDIDESSIITKVIFGLVPRLVFTEGFLLLSGFGLFFSFSRNPDVRSFYYRRLKRLLIPYILLSAWYFIYTDFIVSSNPIGFLGHITTLAFWTEGNFGGMWYIAVSVLLYSLFPIFYKFMFETKKYIGVRTLFLIGLMVAINAIIYFQFPSYNKMVSIGVSKLPMFIIGIYIGWLADCNMFVYRQLPPPITVKTIRAHSHTLLLLVGIVLVPWFLFNVLRGSSEFFTAYYVMSEKLISIPILCLAFVAMERIHIFRYVKMFLNWFGRYTLELYVLHLLIYCFINGQTWILNIGNGQMTKVLIAVIFSILLAMPIQKAISHINSHIKIQNQ